MMMIEEVGFYFLVLVYRDAFHLIPDDMLDIPGDALH